MHRTAHGGARSRKRVWMAALALAVIAPLAAGLEGAPAQASTPRPSGLSAQSGATATVLSWKPVRGATAYHVQVATSSSFASTLMDVTTVNTHATPTSVVPSGKVYWRVSASTNGYQWGKWSTSSLTRSQRGGPVLLEPADGAGLDQPEHPPVLRWAPVPGARSYQVEIDGEEHDWVDTETYTTKTTSLVPTETQQPGTYWWRVRAFFDNEVNSRPSGEWHYTISPLPPVNIKATDPTMEDVVLQWDPVPGAVDYEVRVSTDNGFNVITDHQYVTGTRYSPPTTYDNASYWWQVRARDVFGQTEEWPVYPERTGVFRRTWPEKPALVNPASGATPSGDLYFQWTPVQHAASYILDVGTDPGFSIPWSFSSCPTTQTTYTPGWSGYSYYSDRCMPTTKGTYYWRVRAIDDNSPWGADVNGRFSEVGSFTWDPSTGASSGSMPGPVTGQRVVLDGNGSSPCTASLASTGGVCSGVTATPTLDWDPVAGATSYVVYLAHDLNFTNMVDGYGDIGNPNSWVRTTNTRFTPIAALPDTQAGEAYYWFVRACNSTGCGLTPEEASNAFQKKSPEVSLVSPADKAVVPDQVTFDWTDYLTTNQATTDPATKERPTQSARSYRIQVSQNPSFTSTRQDAVYEQVVDQTTYTEFAHSYPEGVLYWRVQAIDGAGNGLTWSPVRQFTKASPAPAATAPADGAVVTGVQPFRWKPLPYAHYYDLEVYRNSDTTASPANLALKVTNIRQAAYTASEPLQALGKDFVWRVRRTDYDVHAGAWSPWHRFRVAGKAPALLQPGSTVSRTRGVFSWRATPQAASYRWELRRGSYVEQSATTASTSYAPTQALTKGRYSWRVTSLDSGDHVLRATKWRSVTAK